jgi:hypothetical protein
MNADDPPDERVIYRKRFQGVYFDFRGKSIFARYDRCEFVKCTLLIDRATEQLERDEFRFGHIRRWRHRRRPRWFAVRLCAASV